jgi:hypothetical protein
MLYLATFSWKPEMTRQQMDEALTRRAGYEFPKGLNRVAEYWPAGPIVVALVFETDSYGPVMQVLTDWQDVFEIVVYPATTAEEGLRLGAEAMQRRKAA